jgi:hypothetical protein
MSEEDLMPWLAPASLQPGLLVSGIVYFGTLSKLFNKFLEAYPGVLSGCLVGLLVLNENLAEAFCLIEDGIHKSDELGITVFIRLKFTQVLVLANLLDDMGNEANPCSLPFMHDIVEPNCGEEALQPDPLELGGHCLVEVASNFLPSPAEVIAIFIPVEDSMGNIIGPAYLGHVEAPFSLGSVKFLVDDNVVWVNHMF